MGVSSKRGRAPLEIDNEISQVAAKLEDDEKGILRVVQMGGTQALNEIAEYNQDVGRICNYCLEAVSTSEHVRWGCKHFDATRKEIDPELAAIPHEYFPNCLKNGIAPAMKAEGNKPSGEQSYGKTSATTPGGYLAKTLSCTHREATRENRKKRR